MEDRIVTASLKGDRIRIRTSPGHTLLDVAIIGHNWQLSQRVFSNVMLTGHEADQLIAYLLEARKDMSD